jgi:hypothetical protein
LSVSRRSQHLQLTTYVEEYDAYEQFAAGD